MSQQPYGSPAGWPAGSPGGSAPPPSAAGYGTSPSGYAQPSGGYGAGYGQQPPPAGPPARPAKAKAGAAAWVLGVLAVLLLVGVGVLASSASGSLSDQRRQITTLESQSAAGASSDAASSAAAVPKVDTAALQAKYKAVKDADAAVAGAIQKWNSDSSTKFGVVIDALQICYRKVDDYDRAMAPVPASLRGSLPAKVDLNNPQTDCSRSSLKRL